MNFHYTIIEKRQILSRYTTYILTATEFTQRLENEEYVKILMFLELLVRHYFGFKNRVDKKEKTS